MITTTPLFQNAILYPYTSYARAVLMNTQFDVGAIADADGIVLDVIDGDVTLDATATIRASLSLVVAAGWPKGTDPTLEVLPYGSEIAVSRGIVYGNGNIERCQLGIFRVDTIDETARGQLTITAYDRTKVVAEAQFLTPWQTPSGLVHAGDAVAEILQDIWNPVFLVANPVWDIPGLASTFLPRQMQENTDRLGLIQAIVGQLGQFFWFDNTGQSRVSPIPNYNALSPVWSVNARNVKVTPGTLITTERHASRQDSANAAVVQGQGLDGTTPVTGYAYDSNPSSPTYWNGPFGKLPVFLSTSLTAQADVDALAITTLSQKIGLPMSIDFTSLVNPALEPNDAVSITPLPDPYANPVGTGDTEVHVIEAVKIPLMPATAMQAHTRLQSEATLTNGNPND